MSGAGPVDDYASEVARRVRSVLGDRLAGVWLVGSLALGDFQPGRSDIDIQAVAVGPVPLAQCRQLAGLLAHGSLPVPARGLEFVLYARPDLALPGGPRFALNLNTGPGMDHHVAFDPDDDPGFWFAIDVDIARSTAVPLTGPPAGEVFPTLPRRDVAVAVLEGLDWWTAHSGTPTQTLLSACRSWAWATEGGGVRRATAPAGPGPAWRTRRGSTPRCGSAPARRANRPRRRTPRSSWRRRARPCGRRSADGPALPSRPRQAGRRSPVAGSPP